MHVKNKTNERRGEEKDVKYLTSQTFWVTISKKYKT